MTDQEFNKVLRKVRNAAAKDQSSIIQGTDSMGCTGFMVIDGTNNAVTAGEGFTLSLDDVAGMFGVKV